MVSTMTQKSEKESSHQHFFDFAAEIGLTKHLGGLEATKKLAELCHISRDKNILDVGCGVGQTACFIAEEYDCKVVGVDINERMIDRSRERANSEGLTSKTEFRVANAQELPFEDNIFDAVITESVTAFPEDKQKTVNEYARVIKTGGYVGLNESTWLKMPPPPELWAWASQEIGACVKPLPSDEWTKLLKNAGLTEIVVDVQKITIRKEGENLFPRYGYFGMLRSILRAIFMYAKNPDYRRFVNKVRKEGIAPENIEEYFGYGLYVGKK